MALVILADVTQAQSQTDIQGRKSLPALQPVIIAAPFGNYIQPAGCTPTLGTFTAQARPGRLQRILLTVRYYPRLKAWVNKIGLRNPGIDWLLAKANAGQMDVSDKIVSIHGFEDSEWTTLIDKLASIKPLAMELNMSCPNVGHVNWPEDLFERAMATSLPVIVKLPPVNYQQMAQQAVDAGVGLFHCCNTLPVPAGGISGKPLKPVALQCIHDMRQRFGDALTIVGGGGIYQPEDVDDYLAAGVQHISLATKVMNPIYLLTHAPLQKLIQHATARCASTHQLEAQTTDDK